MKNVYTQGIRAPDSMLGYNVSNLHSLSAEFQRDYYVRKLFCFQFPVLTIPLSQNYAFYPFKALREHSYSHQKRGLSRSKPNSKHMRFRLHRGKWNGLLSTAGDITLQLLMAQQVGKTAESLTPLTQSTIPFWLVFIISPSSAVILLHCASFRHYP